MTQLKTIKQQAERINELENELEIYKTSYKLQHKSLKSAINIQMDLIDIRIKELEVYNGIPNDTDRKYLGI
jgi:hypothetical protein